MTDEIKVAVMEKRDFDFRDETFLLAVFETFGFMILMQGSKPVIFLTEAPLQE